MSSITENAPVNQEVSISAISDALLDQLSISPTNSLQTRDLTISDALRSDIEFELEQSHAVQAEKCENRAPFVFFVDNTGKPRIVQGCCNNWQCARCGQIRARHEYGRIVSGARELAAAGHELYFWTLTCRGRDMPLEQAESDYLTWTNRLLNAASMKAKREGDFWAYVQITERQRRQHPHSHIISTYAPSDAMPTIKIKNGKPREVLQSAWFAAQNERAGLGSQHEITRIDTPEAAAVYVSKYLFKDSMTTAWPKNWRRVRYSRSWPKLPEQHPEIAWPLIHMADWRRVELLGVAVYADSEITLEAAYARLMTCVMLA
jgi:hypothetical protein